MRYAATYSFNVRRYIKREIEAESHEEAERIAKAEAWGDIDAECDRMERHEHFGSTADIDAYLMLDLMDDEGRIEDEIIAETLPEPTPAPPQLAA